MGLLKNVSHLAHSLFRYSEIHAVGIEKIKSSEKLEFHNDLLSAFASTRTAPILPIVLFVAVWVALVFIELHSQRVGYQLPNLGILCCLHHVGHDLADLWIVFHRRP